MWIRAEDIKGLLCVPVMCKYDVGMPPALCECLFIYNLGDYGKKSIQFFFFPLEMESEVIPFGDLRVS